MIYNRDLPLPSRYIKHCDNALTQNIRKKYLPLKAEQSHSMQATGRGDGSVEVNPPRTTTNSKTCILVVCEDNAKSKLYKYVYLSIIFKKVCLTIQKI